MNMCPAWMTMELLQEHNKKKMLIKPLLGEEVRKDTRKRAERRQTQK
jgi:hypothetical protein